MKRNTKGFTLIELLIVVVIIGILAAIAIPKFAATKEKAYLATMKTDLKNLATAEEGYASNASGAYIPATTWALPSDSTGGFSPSAGVSITSTAVASGWNAIASHKATPKKCYIYVGAAGAPAGAVAGLNEGAPACDP